MSDVGDVVFSIFICSNRAISLVFGCYPPVLNFPHSRLIFGYR